MAVALDIIKNKTWLDDALAQQALDVKNKDWVEAFKDFVTKNKPIQPANPPVTPPTPTPTGQTIQGVNGENFQVAPTNPNTGLSQPAPNTVAPTPVVPEPIKAPEPIKTEVTSTKIEPVIDFTKADGRESEIKTNVEGFIKSGMTPDKVKEASGYEMASPEKKAIIDGIIGWQVKPNADQIFTSLKQGVSVWDPKSIEFRQAQARVNTFKKFSTYDTASLATSLSSGDLLVGTRAYNDLVSDPTMSAKIQKAQAFNKWEVDLVKVGETQMANVLAQNPTVANALDDNFISQDEYNKLTNNAEVSAQGKLVETNKTKYETIKAKYDAVEDEVDSEFTWKEVTDSFKAKIVADRRKWMYKDYQIASLEYQNSLGTYTNLKADATALLAQNMELYKDQKAQEAEIAKEQRTMQNSLALSQMEYDQKIAQQAQAMWTPELAIPSVIEQYAKEGIFAQKSAQQHIADAKAFIANGGTLGKYISQMQKDFQAKDSYKAKFAPKQDTTPYQIANLGDGKAIMYNQSTGAYNVIGGGGQLVTTQQIPSIVEECRTTWSCGQWVNDYLQKLGDTRVFGNSYSEKQAKINSQEPVVWGIAVWQPTGKMAQPEYGHVGIVSAVNGDQVTITDWNWNGDNKQSTHTVPLSSIQANGGGFYVPKTQSIWKTFNDNDIALLGSVEKLDKQGKETLKENGYSEKDWANFKAWLLPPTSNQKTQANTVIQQINDMLTWDALSDAVGTAKTPWIIPWTQRKDFEAKFASFRDNLALSNIDKLKGAMSDKDIEFLRNTASSLNLDMSEAEFIKQMNNIKQKYTNIAEWSPVNSTSQPAKTVKLAKEAVLGIYDKWKSNQK